jgi:alpha-galactosidase
VCVPPCRFSSWCVIGTCGTDYCNENEFMAMADAMVSTGLADIGWHYIVLDDWCVRRGRARAFSVAVQCTRIL